MCSPADGNDTTNSVHGRSGGNSDSRKVGSYPTVRLSKLPFEGRDCGFGTILKGLYVNSCGRIWTRSVRIVWSFRNSMGTRSGLVSPECDKSDFTSPSSSRTTFDSGETSGPLLKGAKWKHFLLWIFL
jgi:hypothetical protein